MTLTQTTRRHAATLIELLVVMAIISALGLLALMILPGIANSDNTLKGASEVQSTLKIAQGMAGSARAPRGVRMLTQGGTVAKEMQFLEAPPVLIAEPQVLVAGQGTNGVQGNNGPRVEFSYDLDGSGNVINRHCYVFVQPGNVDQAGQVVIGSTLVLPTLGFWSRIKSNLGAMANNEVVLEVYPDASLGAATAARFYHFGIYGPPVPLLAEPTIPLPKDIAVDLTLSSPPLTSVSNTYDLMFAPSGQLLTIYAVPGGTTTGISGNTATFLWVRDTTRVANMAPSNPASPPTAWNFGGGIPQFRKGGEQYIVGIRNGFIGGAPVLWPDAATGTYSNGADPYSLARKQLN